MNRGGQSRRAGANHRNVDAVLNADDRRVGHEAPSLDRRDQAGRSAVRKEELVELDLDDRLAGARQRPDRCRKSAGDKTATTGRQDIGAADRCVRNQEPLHVIRRDLGLGGIERRKS